MNTDQIVAAILAAAQTAADGHNRADTYVTNFRIMLAKLREGNVPSSEAALQAVEPGSDLPAE
ncbi:hypothetical protein P7D22_06000 [Lichenihabitans sp. Uapishka_5]|uniref:hypothetical protein n=1 Tax=Lichenihabitans sp. Uapishka_5 TaxID=3037302 RepID=UPI0029E7E8BF|nr:hypothetical protein [Lichenihabitans sp. Uapishka_5]MDX7950731.1 hypothetical protein [Lichenihabitans sp. Uapishka_5]